MKLVLFGLPYSPNLGDGVIAECLAHALRDLVPGAEVVTVDLSGREGFGQVTVRNRSAVLKLLGALPRPARHALVTWKLGRMLDAAEPRWRAAVEGAGAVLIGGGQLFSDADLNFPLKIARAAGIAGTAGVPVAIHAVGVSRNWSAAGARLFSRVFAADLRRVAIRDAPSIAAWKAQVAGASPVPVSARDPGLLAAACYGPAPRQEGWVGLGVTDPALLGYHADAEVAGRGAGFTEALARALVAGGQRVLLFCNGAEEDRAALEALADPLGDLIAAGQVRIAPVSTRPAELAHLVGGLDGLVAHRLHACILGYAYGRPVVGLGWDRKVESFFASVEAERFCVTDPAARPEAVAATVAGALASGVDATVHGRALDEARAAVQAALAACGVGGEVAGAGEG
ncbi:polysaccharide pyruvyl transferase family protein [Acidimangrovimonas sediminis]|uniref:polysaccharide pyruvyl transferase family protein n=1 Tax=Acidimangrovimonas sediminis TaxID=2056283 RepID=UPI001304D287|nr:polysaccharide pyruvyl transferase family protein [Acidimangrovimonas sediminis]